MKNVTPYLSSVNRWAIHGFLRREDVPKERVTLFVANEGEEKEYRKALEAQSHGRKQNWCFFFCALLAFSVSGIRVGECTDSDIDAWSPRQPSLSSVCCF